MTPIYYTQIVNNQKNLYHTGQQNKKKYLLCSAAGYYSGTLLHSEFTSLVLHKKIKYILIVFVNNIFIFKV